MDAWWTSVATAVGWAVLVGLWGFITRSVANLLVVCGFVAAAVLALFDSRPGWHGLGLAVTLLPAVGLYGKGALTGGTAKGFGALGAMLGLGATPAMWVVLIAVLLVNKSRGPKRSLSSHMTYFLAIAGAVAVHEAHILPPSMM